MNALVCIKQVPDTTEIKIDPVKHTLIRTGVPSIVNPFDAYALEMAVRFKETYGGKVVVVSMGPPQAKEALKRCISVGADDAYLITDRAFGGSDSLATSYILSKAKTAIEKKMGLNFDIIFCGKQAIDGDTAQVGPEMAEHLAVPHITLVTDIKLADNKIHVTKLTDCGYDIVEIAMPALITVTKLAYEPRNPSVKSKLAANKAEIHEIHNDDPDMTCDSDKIGLSGSPTKVKKTFTPKHIKDGTMIHEETGRQSAIKLVELLNAAEVL